MCAIKIEGGSKVKVVQKYELSGDALTTLLVQFWSQLKKKKISMVCASIGEILAIVIQDGSKFGNFQLTNYPSRMPRRVPKLLNQFWSQLKNKTFSVVCASSEAFWALEIHDSSNIVDFEFFAQIWSRKTRIKY